ncbi:MAG: hypothetical protein COU32_04215 [Candidatus Magasanikbacteria bacterium CG10_big_fil_rev_8_21_14_0_10_42_10]|uniref:Pycsar effector protein domain-containing protein n=2 Tax=Candidatus Magasanikiibacteriota TaxID=1752731 RepID=A0A2H0TV72_9BACT|nr:MAG: hypothetical protein COU32_04215 [Candidatus Magasanikbacteria bacterium CG10_big_fil_rev_8_21_14_0_10_42_10]PIZ93668.1 MAG: hypothetical protein COX82_02245 [Candidatus Magasanikbacteria bacterium CG_4_10_14_0_2_um_filter_41_10]
MNKDLKLNIDTAFELMKMKFEHLSRATDVLDQKSGYIMAVITAILGGIGFLSTDLIGLNIFTLGVIFICFALLIFFLMNYAIPWHYPPHEDVIYSDKTLKMNSADYKNQMTSDIKKAFQENHIKHKRKSFLFNLAMFFLMIGIMMSLIDLLLG